MKHILTIYIIFFIAHIGVCQTIFTKEKNGFPLEMKKEISCTNVKNQANSGTCWSYSTQSFIESECERIGKGKINLSEMYVVRMIYFEKAIRYVRMLGNTSFSSGGEHSDVLFCIKKYGLVPESVYLGNVINEKPNHNEVDEVLTSFTKSLIKLKESKLSDHWIDALNGILDAYFGKVPTSFIYEGKEYTPQSFVKYLGINTEDYVYLSSFTHHPFYEKFILEVPDNWSSESYQNIPLDDLEATIDYAINNGYSVAWSSDVSEKGFSFRNGVAIVPEKNWEDIPSIEKDSIFSKPIKQRTITQEIRQIAFDNLSTQDDHGMHIIGIAYDNLGQKYYKVKNSWGSDNNDLEGYFFASSSYVRYKTTSICLHKNGIPTSIKSKLNIK